ncbi:MAG: D-2-hydroxyacid dehydrogenase [Gammaproteobacteria bacterium]|nr:D-2-hydroxyacid dehydrogenase [Gammaproteobacteria bacterium]
MAATMTDDHLLIVSPDAATYAELASRADLGFREVRSAADVQGARHHAAPCNIVLGVPALVAECLDVLPRLDWVQSTYAGVDALCDTGLRRDYTLTGVKGIFGELMREYVIGWILALERDLFAVREDQHERRWAPRPFRPLTGLTLGVCGLGSIGEAVARAGSALGMRVVGYRRSEAPCAAVDRCYTGDAFTEFLAEADHVVITLPETTATTGLFDAGALAAMKDDAVLINVGRGRVVDEAALVDALRERGLRAAVLDVFACEPLPETSPLWTLPNAYLTPHNAAPSFPEEVFARFVANYRRYRSGEPLVDVVDFARGY